MLAAGLLRELKDRALGRVDPDRDLLDAAIGGDRRAFDRLVGGHHARLRGFIARRVGTDAVDDVLQETLLAGWTGLARFDRRSGFKAWLYGIALHKCVDSMRKRGRTSVEVPLTDALAGWQSPEALYAAAELRETVRRAMDRLPPPQREVLELYYYAELTLAEIAAALGRNLNTVKYQFYRAHVVVEQGLGPSGAADLPQPARGKAKTRP
ncbi:MAG TPA: RNA polymerase sigma factor [Armatimonadota bacterium]|nr:RNA polymerase sigma factor [Armatimonadota bacterium]